MNILSENENFCAQAPKKEAPCIPIAEARGFTARNDKFRADKANLSYLSLVNCISIG